MDDYPEPDERLGLELEKYDSLEVELEDRYAEGFRDGWSEGREDLLAKIEGQPWYA